MDTFIRKKKTDQNVQYEISSQESKNNECGC